MVITSSITEWRDEPVVPADYDDLEQLVRLARIARKKVLTFDWPFTESGLRALQRAVYEWGTPLSGRYRWFDSRVLAAVNAALGDATYVLSEPKNLTVVADVSCVFEDGVYRLRGHATFDLVFHYASHGVNRAATGALHLGEAAMVLAQAGVALQWDVERLQDERYLGVRNALYGFRVGYGKLSGQPSSEPPLEVMIHFQGPFSALISGDSRCLFTDAVAMENGIYLWTFTVNGYERPWYVGQTERGFGKRLAEHIRGLLSGEYTTYDPKALARGEYYRVAGVEGVWPQSLPSIIANFDAITPHILELVRQIRFYVAPLDGALQRRVEGVIGRYYKREHPTFMLPGLQLPSPIPYDRPLHLTLSSDEPLEGLPAEIHE